MMEDSDDSQTLVTYTYAKSCPSSRVFRVRVNGRPVFVYHTGVADFACFSFAGRVEIEVEVEGAVKEAVIRPLSRGLKAAVEGERIRFGLSSAQNLQIEIDGRKPLHGHANPLETGAPKAAEPGVHYFKGGEVHEAGELVLKENERIYIEGGVVVRGVVLASQAEKVRVCGRGVLDGGYSQPKNPAQRSLVFDRCRDVRVEDIVVIEPTRWMLVLGACERVHVRNLKEIGEVIASDGIDIVGSRDVLIEGCFLKNNDDCIAVKAVNEGKGDGNPLPWKGNVENVLVRDSVLMNDGAGNAMEIGHELQAESIRNIVFRNIDVLHVHGHGAVFSIHNSDRAEVSDVLWENIRIEHCYDIMIDFRILKSRWSRDKERGTVRNVRLKDIFWNRSIYNPGYTKSIIGGWDAGHMIKDVVIQNFYCDGKKVTDADELDLFTKQVSGLRFE